MGSTWARRTRRRKGGESVRELRLSMIQLYHFYLLIFLLVYTFLLYSVDLHQFSGFRFPFFHTIFLMVIL